MTCDICRRSIPASKLMRFLLILVATLVQISVACVALGQEVDTDKAIKSVGSPTWYDRSSDSYAPPETQELADNPIRTEGYSYQPVAGRTGTTGGGGGWNWGGLSGLNADWVVGAIIILIVVVVVVVFVLLAYFSLRNYFPASEPDARGTNRIEVDMVKVEDLPFQVEKREHDNPLDEARALLKAGRFREAIIYLYGYQLLALDQARKIELQRGKTNRMYLRELNEIPRLREIVQSTMLIFEDAYFGMHEISRERMLVAWNQMDEFHRLATQSPAAETAVVEGVPIA